MVFIGTSHQNYCIFNHSSFFYELYEFKKLVNEPLFHHLSYDFVRNLISPFVNDGHIDVIDKDRHFSTTWWSVGCTDSLVYQTFNRILEHMRLRSRRKVE